MKRALPFAILLFSGVAGAEEAPLRTSELAFTGGGSTLSRTAGLTFTVPPGDVNFTVPVRFEAIHADVQAVFVECSVSRSKMRDGRASHAEGQEIGRGATRISITPERRTFAADVSVAIHTKKSLADAQHYSCWYSFEGKSKKGPWRAWSTPQYQHLTGSRVQSATREWTVSGPFTR